MTLLYADTSSLVRAYFADEDDHAVLRKLLLEGTSPVVTSELTLVEFTSAVAAAHRGERIQDVSPVLTRFEWDCSGEGAITMLKMDPTTAMPTARELVRKHPLRTLDALHLASALHDAVPLAGGDPVTFVTRDQQQAEAARTEGLGVR